MSPLPEKRARGNKEKATLAQPSVASQVESLVALCSKRKSPGALSDLQGLFLPATL